MGKARVPYIDGYDEVDPAIPVSPKTRSEGTQSEDSMATFERLAVVISVYKVARYSWEKVERDEHVAWKEKMTKRRNLQDAYADLLWFIDRLKTLPPSSRQQLSILFYETQSQEVGRRLQPRYLSVSKKRSVYRDSSDTDSDGDDFDDSSDAEKRPFPYRDDPFSVLHDPYSLHSEDSEPDSP